MKTSLKTEKLLSELELKPPKRYKVILHNDHYTTFDFVIELLISIFNHPYPKAHKLSMVVHRQGKAVVGIYPKEVAETKIYLSEQLATLNEFPLRLTMEKED